MLNLKRKVIAIAILAIPAALASAQSASPADYSGLVRQGFFGSQTQSRPDSTIKISSTTGSVYVNHLKTAMIENDKGQSFTWHFGSVMSISNFPLKAIAPSGFDAGNTQVIVLHPGEHFAG